MTPDLRRVEAVLADLEKVAPEDQAARLEEACAGEPALRQRVELLLRAHADAQPVPGAPVLRRDTAEFIPASGVLSEGVTLERSGAFGPGRRFGDYELLGEIARGGMGVVYRARQVRLNRVVALKMILKGELATALDVQRFRTEAESVASLDHPNIVPVYEVGEHDGWPYFSMKLIEGASLAEKAADLVQAPRAAARLVAAAARGVHYAHQRGILHRDLKPANILIDAEGRPHVTDFGLAKRVEGAEGVTQSGTLLGTPHYMAPEQAAGQKSLTIAADVYSLGAVLYECLTGRPPFLGETTMAVLLQVSQSEPLRPAQVAAGVPRDLETICLKCLQKDPQKRYASADALSNDLERWLAGNPIRARRVSRLERAVKWARRQPVVAALLAAVVVTAAAGVTGIVWKYRDAERQKAIAEKERANARRQKEIAKTEHEKVVLLQRVKASEAEARQQLDRARQTLFTAQLMRVGGQWDRDPVLARKLLDDVEVCPPSMRDFAWGLYRHLSAWDRQALPLRARALAYSPDGKTLALGGDKAILMWDVATKKERSIPTGHEGFVQHLAFSREGEKIVSTGDDGMIRLWEVSTGKALLRPLKGHTGTIKGVAFSPDGKTIASCSGVLDLEMPNPDRRWGKGEIQLWDAATGASRTLLAGNAAAVTCLSFSPDGATLAAGTTYESHVKLFNLSSGKSRDVLSNGPGWVESVAFSPDGKYLAAGSADHTVRLWDLLARRVSKTFRGHAGEVDHLAFSPDGAQVISTSTDQTTRLWNVAGGRERAVLRHPAPVVSMTVSPDGQALAVCSRDDVVLWRLSSGAERAAFQARTRGVVAFAPDGQTVAANDKDGNVMLLDPRTGGEQAVLGSLGAAAACLAFSADGAVLAGGSANDAVKVWDAASRRERAVLRGHAGGASAVAFAPGGKTLAVAAKGLVKLWRLVPGKEGQLLRQQKVGGKIASLAFARDGATLATGDAGGKIELWDVIAGRRTATLDANAGPVRALAFAPDGKSLASAHPSAAHLWDLPSGRRRGTFPDGARSLAFTPDGQTLAVGKEASIQLWNVKETQLRASLFRYTRPVVSVAFTPDGKTLLSASSAVSGGWWVTGGEAVLWPTSSGDAPMP